MRSTDHTDEIIKVPQDMLIDILSIFLKEELKYDITEVLESRSIAVIAISIDSNKSRQLKALQNIKELLNAYNEFRYSENETLNWREN
jgi:hypothetical protein